MVTGRIVNLVKVDRRAWKIRLEDCHRNQECLARSYVLLNLGEMVFPGTRASVWLPFDHLLDATLSVEYTRGDFLKWACDSGHFVSFFSLETERRML